MFSSIFDLQNFQLFEISKRQRNQSFIRSNELLSRQSFEKQYYNFIKTSKIIDKRLLFVISLIVDHHLSRSRKSTIRRQNDIFLFSKNKHRRFFQFFVSQNVFIKSTIFLYQKKINRLLICRWNRQFFDDLSKYSTIYSSLIQIIVLLSIINKSMIINLSIAIRLQHAKRRSKKSFTNNQ